MTDNVSFYSTYKETAVLLMRNLFLYSGGEEGSCF